MTNMTGLYAITPDLLDSAALLRKVEAALEGGARALQYRNKVADSALRLEQARGLARLCRTYHVPLIINDHPDLALEIDAEGLHIGAEDGSVAEARRRLGADKILGVTCYRKIENALEAARMGASYVAFGGFFASPVKGGTGGAPMSRLPPGYSAGFSAGRSDLKRPVIPAQVGIQYPADASGFPPAQE
jgi:thiamine-phosphate pyrophosphorylase